MIMTKYEKLIEYIISDQEDLAKQLFHEIVVEKSREIYEGIVQEEDDEFGGDEVDDFMDDIEYDEDGIREAEGDEEDEELEGDGEDEEFGDEEESDDEYDFSTDSEDDADMDMDLGGEEEFGDEGDEEGEGDGDLEDRILDLETAMDELRAEFSRQEGGEEEFGDEEDEFAADDEFGGEEEIDTDEFGGEEEFGDEEDDSDFDVDDELNQIREYVEKINNPVGAEGKEAAKGGGVSVNKSSVVAKKNDMGGSTKNVVKGGSEKNPDGKAAKEPSNYVTKGRTKVKHADKFENVPKAKTKGYTNKQTAVKKEPAGANKTSIEKGSK